MLSFIGFQYKSIDNKGIDYTLLYTILSIFLNYDVNFYYEQSLLEFIKIATNYRKYFYSQIH